MRREAISTAWAAPAPPMAPVKDMSRTKPAPRETHDAALPQVSRRPTAELWEAAERAAPNPRRPRRIG